MNLAALRKEMFSALGGEADYERLRILWQKIEIGIDQLEAELRVAYALPLEIERQSQKKSH